MRTLIINILISLLTICTAVTVDAKDFTVVIDPGHGGKDHGAPGKVTNEKTINLNVARKIAKLIEKNMPEVKIVQTRSNDTFVTLQGRADIANKAGGDLFISIHTNSVDKKNKNHNTVAGASVYTLGFRRSEENLAVAMRENEVMKLEADYSEVYEGFDPSSTESYIIFEMSQNKHMEQSIQAASAIQKELVLTAGRRDRGVRQANFWVLFKTGMPAILVELDFICNPAQEAFMHSEEGQNKLAQAVYNGFAAYKRAADHQREALEGKTPIKTTPPSKPPKTKETTRTETESQPRSESADPARGEKKSITGEKKEAPVTANAENTTEDKDIIIYKVQFLTSGKALSPSSPQLKGITDAESYQDGAVLKYTTGNHRTPEDAGKHLREVKKKFPDAFIIKTLNGKRIK